MTRLACLAALAIAVSACSGGGGSGDVRAGGEIGAGGGTAGGGASGGSGAGNGNGNGVDGGNGGGSDAGVISLGGDGPTAGGSSDGSTAGPAPTAGAANERLTQAEISRRIFDPAVTEFAVRVFREEGANPYTGPLGLTSNDTWDITAESFGELFGAHGERTIAVPRTLAQMPVFEDQGIQNWTIGNLVDLGRSLAPPLSSGSEVGISVIFVNGLYEGNVGILGIHPTNSPFSFVFKDVVESVGSDSTTRRYVEQTTIVHEIGHTIGFVDNGVPMVNAHEDTEHPHHTLDRDGVMYWAVESRNGALAFLTDAIAGSRLSLFGPASLLDAQNYMPSD